LSADLSAEALAKEEALAKVEAPAAQNAVRNFASAEGAFKIA
jgi:hypothetical protein